MSIKSIVICILSSFIPVSYAGSRLNAQFLSGYNGINLNHIDISNINEEILLKHINSLAHITDNHSGYTNPAEYNSITDELEKVITLYKSQKISIN